MPVIVILGGVAALLLFAGLRPGLLALLSDASARK